MDVIEFQSVTFRRVWKIYSNLCNHLIVIFLICVICLDNLQLLRVRDSIARFPLHFFGPGIKEKKFPRHIPPRIPNNSVNKGRYRNAIYLQWRLVSFSLIFGIRKIYQGLSTNPCPRRTSTLCIGQFSFTDEARQIEIVFFYAQISIYVLRMK